MGKLFVGNLPFTATDNDLKNHFEKIGKVDSAKIILNRETNRSRGFGFVEMEDSEKAMAELNESEMGDPPRKIHVNIAQERRERGPHGGREGR